MDLCEELSNTIVIAQEEATQMGSKTFAASSDMTDQNTIIFPQNGSIPEDLNSMHISLDDLTESTNTQFTQDCKFIKSEEVIGNCSPDFEAFMKNASREVLPTDDVNTENAQSIVIQIVKKGEDDVGEVQQENMHISVDFLANLLQNQQLVLDKSTAEMISTLLKELEKQNSENDLLLVDQNVKTDKDNVTLMQIAYSTNLQEDIEQINGSTSAETDASISDEVAFFSINDKIMNEADVPAAEEEAFFSMSSFVLRNTENGEPVFLCGLCQTKIVTTKKFRQHIEGHILAKPALCLLCNQRFKSQKFLEMHMKRHTETEGFECTQCKKKFYTKANLKRHESTHSNSKPYQCTYCSAGFLKDKAFERHVQTHTKSKSYICTICTKGYRNKYDLERHQRIHLDVKPYQCLKCPKTFCTNSELRIHTMWHDGDRPFKCLICPKSFLTNSALISHSSQHNNSFPYRCENCEKGFKNRTSFRIHSRKYHSGESKLVEIKCMDDSNTLDTNTSESASPEKCHLNKDDTDTIETNYRIKDENLQIEAHPQPLEDSEINEDKDEVVYDQVHEELKNKTEIVDKYIASDSSRPTAQLMACEAEQLLLLHS